MDLSEAVTVTKLDIQYEGENCYLLIGWQIDSFEIYIFNNGKIWKGRFSPNRLAGFSRNLQLSEVEYFKSVKRCLSQRTDNYIYELKSDFFYWKRKEMNNIIIEGFLPMDLDSSPKNAQPDLIEILLLLNNNLKDKLSGMKYKFEAIKSDYEKCLKDTEEFLCLKIDMEKALCDKFLSLLNVKKSTVNALELNNNGELIKDKEQTEIGALQSLV